MKKSWSSHLFWSAVTFAIFSMAACGQKKEENNGKPVTVAEKLQQQPVTSGTDATTSGTSAVTTGTGTITSGTGAVTSGTGAVTAGTGKAAPASPADSPTTSGTNSVLVEGLGNSGSGAEAVSSIKASIAKKTVLINITQFEKSFDDKENLIRISFHVGLDGDPVIVSAHLNKDELANKRFVYTGEKISFRGNLRCKSIECEQLFINLELSDSTGEKVVEAQIGAVKDFTGSKMLDTKGKSDQIALVNQIDLTKADAGPLSFDNLCTELDAIINKTSL